MGTVKPVSGGEFSEVPRSVTTLRRLASVLVTDIDGYASKHSGEAKVIEPGNDELWTNGWQYTENSIDFLLRRLRSGLTAQTGALVTRTEPQNEEPLRPRIIIATTDTHPDEFGHDRDERDGWSALARAHRRECGWDFPPSDGGATWIGWWEPYSAVGSGDECTVFGALVGFVRIDLRDRVITHVHVASSRRRQGIARQLASKAKEAYGITGAAGPFTNEGAAWVAAVLNGS